MLETIKLLCNPKKLITNKQKSENLPSPKVIEVVLVQYSTKKHLRYFIILHQINLMLMYQILHQVI